LDTLANCLLTGLLEHVYNARYMFNDNDNGDYDSTVWLAN